MRGVTKRNFQVIGVPWDRHLIECVGKGQGIFPAMETQVFQRESVVFISYAMERHIVYINTVRIGNKYRMFVGKRQLYIPMRKLYPFVYNFILHICLKVQAHLKQRQRVLFNEPVSVFLVVYDLCCLSVFSQVFSKRSKRDDLVSHKVKRINVLPGCKYYAVIDLENPDVKVLIVDARIVNHLFGNLLIVVQFNSVYSSPVVRGPYITEIIGFKVSGWLRIIFDGMSKADLPLIICFQHYNTGIGTTEYIIFVRYITPSARYVRQLLQRAIFDKEGAIVMAAYDLLPNIYQRPNLPMTVRYELRFPEVISVPCFFDTGAK